MLLLHERVSRFNIYIGIRCGQLIPFLFEERAQNVFIEVSEASVTSTQIAQFSELVSCTSYNMHEDIPLNTQLIFSI